MAADKNIVMDYDSSSANVWSIKVDGLYTSTVKKQLMCEGVPESGTEQIIKNAVKTLQYCPDPTKFDEKRMTGIVIGKVQSGKTANFIALTALAFDNGYSHVVILGGTKNVLLQQNSERIQEYFREQPDVIVLNTKDHKSELSSAKISGFIQRRKKVIIVTLKRPDGINSIRENVFCNNDLADLPTLIIDDEGDEASLNALINRNQESATYRAIKELKAKLKSHCFVSVTATPQANLLIRSLDVLSPDFGVLVDPGEGYCGLDVFHTPDSKYTVEIPDGESTLLDDGIPKSFFDALSMFFVSCGIYAYRGKNNDDKLSMLVHPSHMKADHNMVYKKVQDLVEEWKLKSQNKGDIAYQRLKDRLKTAYQNYKKETIPNVPPFEVLEEYILNAIQGCGIHVVNGESVPNGVDKFYEYNIYIGGNMLGRGLTLKGLAITYIFRSARGASSVDTVQQRARWFGYKSKYIDLCRVFATGRILSDFMNIREHEEDLWNTVREVDFQGTQFKNMARIFVLSNNPASQLRMTRTSVARQQRFRFTPWNIQRIFQDQVECANNNLNIINQFREKYKQQLNPPIRFGDGLPYTILENMPFEVILSDIIEKFEFPEESLLDRGMCEKLKVLLHSKNITPYIDVIWMRDDPSKPAHPYIGRDNHIKNYMVGKRREYLGDRYQFEKPDVMQLQIHMIENTEEPGVISPTLALYIPIKYISQLTDLIIRG